MFLRLHQGLKNWSRDHKKWLKFVLKSPKLRIIFQNIFCLHEAQSFLWGWFSNFSLIESIKKSAKLYWKPSLDDDCKNAKMCIAKFANCSKWSWHAEVWGLSHNSQAIDSRHQWRKEKCNEFSAYLTWLLQFFSRRQ